MKIKVIGKMKKLVGKVTEAERDAIKLLYQRKNGLVELTKIVSPENTDMYEKLVADMGETCTRFSDWWYTMSKKYNWESRETGHWNIDFDDCSIYLLDD